MSPALTGYSRRSFPSASAFPRRRSRCASAGGAPGCEASAILIAEIGSAVDTGNVNVFAGFDTLNVTEMVSIDRMNSMSNWIRYQRAWGTSPVVASASDLGGGGGGKSTYTKATVGFRFSVQSSFFTHRNDGYLFERTRWRLLVFVRELDR